MIVACVWLCALNDAGRARADLFVSSYANSSVLEYNGSTGAFVKTFVTPESSSLDGAEGLVFGPNGNLFVVNF